jgi:hypothetical protein
MAEVWQDGNDLVGMAKGCDERADRRALAKIVQQFEFVENASRTRSDVDLLDCHEARSLPW